MVGAGPESEPRHLAIDPQHRRLSRRDRCRSSDADPRPRRHHADPPHRDLGLAHADPPHLRPRGAANRVLDSLHDHRCGICKLLAAWRLLAAADRARRRGRRRAGARARNRVRPAEHGLSAPARFCAFCGHDRNAVGSRWFWLAGKRTRADADRGRRYAIRRRRRSQLGSAGMDRSCGDEHEGTARPPAGIGLQVAGIQRADLASHPTSSNCRR
jgi:hypothetical protein